MVERESNRCLQATIGSRACKHGVGQDAYAMEKGCIMMKRVEPWPSQALQRTRGTRTAEP